MKEMIGNCKEIQKHSLSFVEEYGYKQKKMKKKGPKHILYKLSTKSTKESTRDQGAKASCN